MYTEKYKTLQNLKKTEIEIYSGFINWMNQCCQNVHTNTVNYTFSRDPINTPMTFFTHIKKYT